MIPLAGFGQVVPLSKIMYAFYVDTLTRACAEGLRVPIEALNAHVVQIQVVRQIWRGQVRVIGLSAYFWANGPQPHEIARVDVTYDTENWPHGFVAQTHAAMGRQGGQIERLLLRLPGAIVAQVYDESDCIESLAIQERVLQ